MSRRRVIGWSLAIGFVSILLLMYSLTGWITGVYRFTAIDHLGPGKGYLVSDGSRWLTVFIWEGHGISGEEMSAERALVVVGIWTMDLHLVKVDGSTRVTTPLNLFDVYALRFGEHREAVSKLGKEWVDPPGTP